jgi:hypothetical protein
VVSLSGETFIDRPADVVFDFVADERNNNRAPAGVRETLPETLRGQDLLTLLTVPVLLWTGARARAGSLRAVAAIGLAAYAVLNGLLRNDVSIVSGAFTDAPRRPVVAGWLLPSLWRTA